MRVLCALLSVAGLAMAHGSQSTLRFLSIGDWGGDEKAPYTTGVQLQVAQQLGQTAADQGSQFVLALGDNFYNYGISCYKDYSPDCVATAHSHRFRDTFEAVYDQAALQTPWYVVSGNHDWKGNVSAELAYTNRSSRWTYPDYWYTFTKSFNNGTTAQFVAIDTILLTGEYDDVLDEGGQPRPFADPALRDLGDEQWAWLESTLAQSTATWLYVFGHYPVWSAASHGPTLALVQRMKPMLEKYGVAAYICGHDHTLEHLNDGSNVEYFVIGSGHSTSDSTKHEDAVPPGSLKFIKGVGGFMFTEAVNATSAHYDIIDSSGNLLEQVWQRNPRSN